MLKNAEKFRDRLSAKYDRSESIAEIESYQSMQSIMNYLNRSDSILDFGCATGTISCYLAGFAADIHGIDISSKMISIAELLKPGGYFVSMTPCLGEKTVVNGLLKMAGKIRLVPIISCFKTDELTSLHSKAKLELIENRSIDGNPLEYFVIARKKA